MSSHYLPIYGANAAGDAEDLTVRLASNEASFDDLRQLSKFHRIAGIAALLAEADTEQFQSTLASSGRDFLAWLDQNTGGQVVLSQCDALLDTIAANHWSLACSLAQRLWPATWSQEREYEEDYLSFSLLQANLVEDLCTQEDRAALLERYGELEGDEIDWRLNLWRAMYRRDGDEFERALEGLLLQAREDFDYLRSKDALLPEELETLGNVSIEGIAMWRLGNKAGFALQSDYLFVPSLALNIPAR